MTLASVVFYIFAALAIVSGIFILFTKNVLYAGFSLLCALTAVAAIYVFAGADFLAVAQIMIYVGGIMVLILFGVMLTNRMEGQSYIHSGNRNVFISSLTGVILFAVLVTGIQKAKFSELPWIQTFLKTAKPEGTTIGKIGTHLLTDYVLPFEVAGLLLMVALMGAAFIASRAEKKL